MPIIISHRCRYRVKILSTLVFKIEHAKFSLFQATPILVKYVDQTITLFTILYIFMLYYINKVNQTL